VAEWLKAPLC